MVAITEVRKGSVADKAGIAAGDVLLSVNSKDIGDVLDYRFYLCERRLTLRLLRGGKAYSVTAEKDEYDDIGLEFGTYLMDEKRRCANNCIFCFIDQNPCGMRDTIYFKDDDTRLSFLMGNYVTLTNLGERDIDRIIRMKMSPVNVSVHTSNPELREKMLRNKNAGESLEYLKKLDDGGIELHCQIVLCRGINDGKELARTMNDLAGYRNVRSVSVVPAGLTAYREGLYPLTTFSKEEAGEVIDQVESFAGLCFEARGEHIFCCADELYLRAGRALPGGDYYDGYPQIENGVGMITSLREEFLRALDDFTGDPSPKEFSMATGEAAFGLISGLAGLVSRRFEQIKIHLYKIKNGFFGESVTVAGLLTGRDISEQLAGKALGEKLLLPDCTLRREDDVFLCGMTAEELSEKLGVKLQFCPSDGYELLSEMIGND